MKLIDRRLKTINMLLPHINGKVLDVGCNRGYITNYLSSEGYDVLGIDFNPKWIDYCKKEYPDCKFELSNILEENRKFDTILMIGVLEEIPNHPKEVLNKLKENLNTNGKIIIQVRNMKSLKRRLKTFFGMELVDCLIGHIYIFTPERLKNVVEECGYKIIELTSNKFDVFRDIIVFVPDNFAEESIIIIEDRK